MNIIGVDTETLLIPPEGTAKIRTRVAIPDLVVTSVFGAWYLKKSGMWVINKKYSELLFWDDAEAHLALFTDPNHVFAFHNAAFDLAVLSRAHPPLRPILEKLCHEGRILDTRVLYLLRDPDPTHRAITLKYLAGVILCRELDKGAVRTSFTRTKDLTADQRKYALQDAEVTAKIAEALLEIPLGALGRSGGRVKRIAARRTFHRDPDRMYSSAAALLAWHLVPTGMAVDRDLLRNLHGEYTRKVGEGLSNLVVYGLSRVVRLPLALPKVVTDKFPGLGRLTRTWEAIPNHPAMMARRHKGNIEVIVGKVQIDQLALRRAFGDFAAEHALERPSTPSGLLSLKRDDWKDHIHLMPQPLVAYMDYQRQRKYLSAFLAPLVEANATRVHPRYWIPGAATGRWSCRWPNLQQVPKGRGGRQSLREIYTAGEGRVLVSADYPSLELYTLADSMSALGIEGALMRALRAGEDIHTLTAQVMNNSDEITKEQRFFAKACNFGLPGGMGVRRLRAHMASMGVEKTFEEVQGIRNRWFATYPDVKQFLSELSCDPYRELKPRDLDTSEWLEGLGFHLDDTWPSGFDLSQKIDGGRIYEVTLPGGRVLPRRRYSAAANSFFQGPGADVITAAFVECCRFPLRVVAVVHDMITVETSPEEDPHECVGKVLTKIMGDALMEVCPAAPRPRIEYSVGKAWS